MGRVKGVQEHRDMKEGKQIGNGKNGEEMEIEMGDERRSVDVLV